MTDQQLAFRALADFGHRWRLVRGARWRSDRQPAQHRSAVTGMIFASLAPWLRL